MALPIQKLREAIFQLLYSMDFHIGLDDEMIDFIMQELKITKKNAIKALTIAKEIHLHIQQLDLLLEACVSSYEVERIHSVERCVLRMIIYECIIRKTIPIEIAISEAKRLVKKFSSSDAEGFVQAILDTMYKSENKPHVPPVQT